MSKLPFGTHSHYLEPWRGYLETGRAADFIAGIGVHLEQGWKTQERALELLARSGVATVRLEISWSELAFEDERRLVRGDEYRRVLGSCRRLGLRPLILLNAHHGLPVPTRRFAGIATEDVPPGARRLKLEVDEEVIPGRTGISNLSEFWAAEVLFVGSEGDRLILSKPLPRGFHAGEKVQLATLKYEPFAEPGGARMADTLAGWARYLDAVATLATEALGAGLADDKGFDLEIWNELSFGSKFLSINNYYASPVEQFRDDQVWAEIVSNTARFVAAHPTRFAGVTLTNGFASTVPWPSSANQPERLSGLSKHPYPRKLSFPRDEPKNTKCVDRQGRATDHVPSYEAFFPEYFASALQTETITRDLQAATTEIYGREHGRYARILAGEIRPVWVWITEVGVNPKEIGIRNHAAAQDLKAKATARFLLFYLNKGAKRVYLYSDAGGDGAYGLIPDAFLAAGHEGAGASSSPSLDVIRRIKTVMGAEIDPALRRTRSLDFALRAGEGSAPLIGHDERGTAPLRAIDALALLPFQANQGRFVIAHYVVTRDIRVSRPPEEITIDILGLHAGNLTFEAYDPLADARAPVRAERIDEKTVRAALSISDSPCLLIVEEQV